MSLISALNKENTKSPIKDNMMNILTTPEGCKIRILFMQNYINT